MIQLLKKKMHLKKVCKKEPWPSKPKKTAASKPVLFLTANIKLPRLANIQGLSNFMLLLAAARGFYLNHMA